MNRSEAAVAVVVAGTLALTSSACMRRYIANSKTAEARNSLGQIAKLAAAAYEREKMPSVIGAGAAAAPVRELCASASKSVPASAAAIRGMKYQSAMSDWTVDAPDGGFACLKFAMDMPQYYQYSYVRSGKGSATGDSFTGTANGDLNGDGVLSTFQIRGAIGAGGMLNVAPTLVETNPLE